MENKKEIDWEERRFIVSSMLLAGMAANYDNTPTITSYDVENAVLFADYLIQILADTTRPSVCAELYQR